MRKYSLLWVLVVFIIGGCDKPTAMDIPRLECNKIVLRLNRMYYSHLENPKKEVLIATIEDESAIAMVKDAIAKDFVEIKHDVWLDWWEMKVYHGKRINTIECAIDITEGIVYFRDGYSRQLFDVLEKLGFVRRISAEEIKMMEEHVKRIFPSEGLNKNDPNQSGKEKKK